MWLNKITVAASDSLPMGDSGLGTGLKRQTGPDESVLVTPPKRIRAQLDFTPPKITKKTNQGGESAEPDYDFLAWLLDDLEWLLDRAYSESGPESPVRGVNR